MTISFLTMFYLKTRVTSLNDTLKVCLILYTLMYRGATVEWS